MDVGEEAPEVPAPSAEENETPVKAEPMEQDPSENPSEEPAAVEPTATEDPMIKEVKDEPMDETPKEESMEATPELQDEKSQEASEVPEVKVEPPAEETIDEMNTSLGNLTADAGVTSAPSFPSVGIKITITSQVSSFSEEKKMPFL